MLPLRPVTSPLPTCAASRSFISYVRVNTRFPPASPPPSASVTSSYESEIAASTFSLPLMPTYAPPRSPPLRLRRRRTVCGVKSLASLAPEILNCAPLSAYVTVSFTPEPTTLTSRPPLPATLTVGVGIMSRLPTFLPHSKPPSLSWAPPLVSLPVMSLPAPFAPPEQWPCFVPTLTPILFAWSVGGAAMRCFATFTSKPNLQCVASQPACFSTVPSFCFQITKSPASKLPPSEFPSMSHVSCSMLATLPSQSTMVTHLVWRCRQLRCYGAITISVNFRLSPIFSCFYVVQVWLFENGPSRSGVNRWRLGK